MYRCEIWSITEKNDTMLNMWEMKILMKIYGPVTEQGVQKIVTNHKMRKFYCGMQTRY
jgi:hypothetical protein